nr:molybdopterin cofactor-binding domain-containing protein [Cupriavidus taiwanensis]
MIDAIAREGTRAVGGALRKPGAARGHALCQRHQQAFRRRRLSGQRTQGHGDDRPARDPCAPEGGAAGSTYVGVGFGTYTEQSAHGTSVFAAWGTPVIPGFDSATVRITPDGGLEVRVGVHSHGQGMETTFAQIAHEILASTSRGSRSCTAIPA